MVSFAFVSGMYVGYKMNITIQSNEIDVPNDETPEKIYTGIVLEIPKEILEEVYFEQNDIELQYNLINNNYSENTALIQFKNNISFDPIYMYYDKIEPIEMSDVSWNQSYQTRRKIIIVDSNIDIIDNFNDSDCEWQSTKHLNTHQTY